MHARALLTVLASLPFGYVAPAAPAVRLWETNQVIPTYLAAPPSPVPRFYEGRTYQGAKATFYPYPVQDVLTDVKSNVSYKALFLENQYVQISVLPELGGRIFSAVDKANGYDFFYRQHVIKPALIGMLGAWISGGVEWNVPHHHRATSFSPVDYTTQTNADGSATIWVGETELRHRMKWLVGLTLRPDRSCLEMTMKMFNQTPFVHPMLFWINTAVHANTNYQVIFPPSTEWAAQHSKPEFASWPIARQVYGGTDYGRGVDISWWKNHPNPVSFFAWNYEDDWFGGYDHGRQAGLVQVADHHVAPGKKFFEWGNGSEGEMWSKILTDEDGPYLELMAGAWSDNQPDYSWLQPGETREWKHYWYPIRNMGGVKMATLDAAVNLELTNRTAKIAVNATREFKNARVCIVLEQSAGSPSGTSSSPSPRPSPSGRGSDTSSPGTKPAANEPSNAQTADTLSLGERAGVRGNGASNHPKLFDQTVDLAPGQPFSATVTLENEVRPERLRLSVTDSSGSELVVYQPAKPKGTPKPTAVEKPKSPKDYATADELYFTGQRIEQLYSPSFEATPYYEEMLRRDPGDSRANTALGILLCKQWRWDEAAKHLSNAIARATANHIRPKDGEAFYYLGVALRAQGGLDAACEAFQSALWSAAWRAAAGCELAEIGLLRQTYPQALASVDLALAAAGRNPKAWNLKATILRKLGRAEDAEQMAAAALAIDPLNVRAASEQVLAQRQRGDPGWRENVRRLRQLMGRKPEAFLENAVELANAGQWPEVVEIMRDQVRGASAGRATIVATEPYLLARALEGEGQADEARRQFDAAAQTSPDFCFPSRFEEEPVLRRAIAASPKDAQAAYLLGCLLYDNQPETAIKAWEEARQRDDTFALTHRNLALAYAQHEKNVPKAITSLEKAVALNPNEPRFFYELDVQYEAGGASVARRLAGLTNHHAVVAQRDDALTREIVLLTVAGQADRAVALLRGRHFRNWEGSSQIHNVYVDACLAHGQQLFADKRYREALREDEAALEYPENLEIGRARRAPRTAQIQYLIGAAHEALGETALAKAAFEKAAAGRDRGASESGYFHAIALQKLGRAGEAKLLFEGLARAGEEQLAKGEAADYFAKFGERQSERMRKANAYYLTGLGHQGLGKKAEAEAAFQKALQQHPAHLGATQQLGY
jgi:tetratricopeptide (TPR) repeat protein